MNGSEPITNDTRHVITNLSRDFYSELPANETKRKEETVRAATTLCSKSRYINQTAFESSSKFDRQSYRLEHATDIINNNFNRKVSTTKLRSAMKSAGGLARYAPLVGSYNRMYKAACAVDSDNDETLERFYIATASFGVEAALVQQQVFFKTSFAATRYTTNHLSLMKIRTVVGDKGYGLLLSEVHWAYRGGQASAISYVFSKSHELNINDSDLEQTAIEDAANNQYEKHHAIIKDEKASVENKTRIAEKCAELSESDESGGFLDSIGDITGELISGLEDIPEMTASDIPEHVNKSIDQPGEFVSCMEERLNDE